MNIEELEKKVDGMEHEMKILRGITLRALNHLGLSTEDFHEIVDQATMDVRMDGLVEILKDITGVKDDNLENFKGIIIGLPENFMDGIPEEFKPFVEKLVEGLKKEREESNVH